MPGIMSIVLVAAAIAAAMLGGVSSERYYNPAMGTVPKEMWAVQAVAEGKMEVRRVPVPEPAKGEILVKVHYSPVNPSDVYAAMGTAGYSPVKRTYPYGAGYEGSGVVVASGGGVVPYVWAKLGLSVAAASLNFKGQFWAEYAITAPMGTLPLPSEVGFKEGAATFVNPLTALAMLEVANEESHKALVHTAASSALGLQLVRAAPKFKVDIVCVVRGEKNVKMLKENNVPADLIVRSDVDTFKADLAKAVKKYSATLAFDAVGGDMSRSVYELMPEESTVFIYGNLSGQGMPEELVEKKDDPKKPFSFFLVGPWLEAGGMLRKTKIAYSLYKMLPHELRTTIEREIDIKDPELVNVLYDYAEHQKGGKMVIKTLVEE